MLLTIDIPDFLALDDEEVQGHRLTRVRDGRWSATTKALLKAFDTDLLQLNEAWANTWQGWVCPSCKRRKIEIARPTPANVLLCQLDWHHDHLQDLAEAVFREHKDFSLTPEEQRGRSLAQAAMYPITLRFTKALICADCNQAEGAMKVALGKSIDRHFSFSPSEIRRFIIARPNMPHDLRTDIGRDIWKEAAQTFRERAAFTRLLAQRVQAGLHGCERSALGQDERSDERLMIYKLTLDAARVQGLRFSLGTDISVRSRSLDGNGSAARLLPPKRSAAPTEEEFLAFNQQMKSPPWHREGNEWRCAICERSKRQLLHKSNRGRWTAHIHSLNSFVLETDPKSIEFRSRYSPVETVFTSHERYQVCQDCRKIVATAASFGATGDCFGPEVLRGLVTSPTPNSPHVIDPNEIRACLEANAEWAIAAQDYWEHFRRARILASNLKRMVANGWRRENAFGHLMNGYMEGNEADPRRTPAEFKWLLREGLKLLRSAAEEVD